MGNKDKNDGGGDEVKYYLVDSERRHSIGPFETKSALFYHIEENSGKSDIFQAVKQFGVVITERVNLLDLEAEYKSYCESKEQRKVANANAPL